MLLEGMLWQDLNIALALNLDKVIVICGIPHPEQAFKKNSAWIRRDDGQPKRLQLEIQNAILFTGQDNVEHIQTYYVLALPVSHNSSTCYSSIHLQMPKLLSWSSVNDILRSL